VKADRRARFEAVYAAEHADLVRFAGLLAADARQGEDLAAEALARFLVVSRRKAIDDAGAYLRRTVANLFIASTRRDRVARRNAHRLPRPVSPAAESEEALADRDRLWEALAALPSRSRTVLVLRYYLDQSVEQVAELLDIAPGTVKSISARSLDVVRSTLEEDLDG